MSRIGAAKSNPGRALCVALLRHDTPDGAHHFDWLFAREDPPAGKLRTFRVPQRVDEFQGGDEVDALPIADHRVEYLTYEGPVSRNRGTVSRVAQGRYEKVVQPRGGPRVESYRVTWDGGRRQVWEFDSERQTMTCVDSSVAW